MRHPCTKDPLKGTLPKWQEGSTSSHEHESNTILTLTPVAGIHGTDKWRNNRKASIRDLMGEVLLFLALLFVFPLRAIIALLPLLSMTIAAVSPAPSFTPTHARHRFESMSEISNLILMQLGILEPLHT